MNTERSVPLKKAARVVGRNLVFRNATPGDAEFIVSLRTDATKSRFLSQTSPDVEAQRAWLGRYASATDQAYFIIEDLQGKALGTIRLYDPQGESFCWGSWILSDERPSGAAIESALMVYSYALDHLGFRAAHFDVRQGNEKVWQFHERFGAVRIREDDLDIFYSIGSDAIRASMQKYAKQLPEAVSVEWLQDA